MLVAGVGSLPRLGDYFPGRLFEWGAGPALGHADPAWAALGVSLGLILTALLAAWLIFRRQEL